MRLLGFDITRSRDDLAKASLASQAVAISDLSEAANGFAGIVQMGPGQPLQPLHQGEGEPRRWDYQPGRNLITRPRTYEDLTFATLRRLCDTYDVARIAIEARKDEARGWDWDIRAKPVRGLDRKQQKIRAGAFAEDIDRVIGFLTSPNQEDDWGTWLVQYLDDLLVIDAPSIYLRRTRGGDIYSLEIIDGATIVPLLDRYGRIPTLPGGKVPKPHVHDWTGTPGMTELVCRVCSWPAAYSQTIHGVPWEHMATYEFIYEPYHQSAASPYGNPPIMWVLTQVNRALRRQSIDLSDFAAGTLPQGIYKMPEGWSGEQLAILQDTLDALLTGDDVARVRMRLMPGGPGTGLESPHPEAKNDVEQWLMHVTAAAFGTSAYELGFEPAGSGLGGAGFGEASRSAAEKRGSKPLSRRLKDLLDRIIAGPMGHPELEFHWRGIGEAEDLLKQSQLDHQYWIMGAKGTDEIREGLGLDPIGLGPTVYDPKLGVVLVEDILATATATAAAEAALTADVLTSGKTTVPSSAPGELTTGEGVGQPASPAAVEAIAGVAKAAELGRWRRKAMHRMATSGDPSRFQSDILDGPTVETLSALLAKATTLADVRAAFEEFDR